MRWLLPPRRALRQAGYNRVSYSGIGASIVDALFFVTICCGLRVFPVDSMTKESLDILGLGGDRLYGGFMRPLKRSHVNKGKSAKQFRHNAGKVKAPNMRGAPMRGGIRL